MFDFHLTPELLQAVARGAFPVDLFQRVMLAHAVRVSPRAYRELERWRFERPGAEVVGQIGGGRYGDVFARVGSALRPALAQAARHQAQAAEELREVACLPPAERLARVCPSRRRFRSAAFVDGALAKAWESLPEDPPSASAWADVAAWSAVRLGAEPPLGETLRQEFRLRSQAFRAVVKHLDEPQKGLLDLGRRLTELRQDLGDNPELEAELAVLEGILLRRAGLPRRAASSFARAFDRLADAEPEDRPWLRVAERELEAVCPDVSPCRPSIRS
jgi:hypothetical protein